jgi:cob(I)alamin adenosyltransferase
MKIYTKKGDNGITYLYDGSLVKKSEQIFDVLGNSDDLGSNIGMLIALISESHIDTRDSIIKLLREIQGNLQHINSELATPNPKQHHKLVKISETEVIGLEETIDMMEIFNDKLTCFILPGVTVVDSQSHICRTATRKLERELYKVGCENPFIMKYINRLSDFFFVLARFICKKLGFTDCKLT